MIYAVTKQVPLFSCDDIKFVSVEESLKVLNQYKSLQCDTETSGWRNFLLIF